jgi:hypothetical protein
MCHVSHQPDELYYWPVLWIRDSGRRRHTTRSCASSGINDEVALRLQVVPTPEPRHRLDRGVRRRQSAQAHPTLPLRWE